MFFLLYAAIIITDSKLSAYRRFKKPSRMKSPSPSPNPSESQSQRPSLKPNLQKKKT